MAEVSSPATLPTNGTGAARRSFTAATAGAPPRQGGLSPSQAGGSANAAGTAMSRSAYQQRLDEVKVRIVDLSHRNMENALRILRGWMRD